MIGEFNKELKQEIDNVQEYINLLWEQGQGDLVLRWIAHKDELTKKIGKEG